MATRILLARVNARSTAVRAPRLEGYPSSAPRHESRHLECERYPGPRVPGAGVAGARAAGRGVPAGIESRAGADPGGVPARGVSRVLAWPQGLFGRVVADSQGLVRRRSRIQSSPVRLRVTHRASGARAAGHRLRLCAERREGLPRVVGLPDAAHGLGATAAGRWARAVAVR